MMRPVPTRGASLTFPRAVLTAVALALVLVPAAYGVVRDGSGRADTLIGTNMRDLLFGAHGSDTLRGRAGGRRG